MAGSLFFRKSSAQKRGAVLSNERASALLSMLNSFTQDLGLQSVILTITMQANHLVQADRCTVFIVDERKNQLWSLATDTGKEIRIPKDKGLAGECATTGCIIRISDAYEDPRFNPEVDKATGYHTKSILAVPLVCTTAEDGQQVKRVYGVIQLINKAEQNKEVGSFTEEDVYLIATFSEFVAARLATSGLIKMDQNKKQGEGQRVFSDDNVRRTSTLGNKQTVDLILEGDTDDDSDESGLGDDVCGIHDEHSQDSLSSSVFGSPEVVHSPPVYPQARNEFSVGNRYFS